MKWTAGFQIVFGLVSGWGLGGGGVGAGCGFGAGAGGLGAGGLGFVPLVVGAVVEPGVVRLVVAAVEPKKPPPPLPPPHPAASAEKRAAVAARATPFLSCTGSSCAGPRQQGSCAWKSLRVLDV